MPMAMCTSKGGIGMLAKLHSVADQAVHFKPVLALDPNGLGVQLGIEFRQEVRVHPAGLVREIPGARVDQVGACQTYV